MAANVVQMQAMQQQTQTNSMLNQLPQQQRSQIETAVNNYRQALNSQGYSSEVIQTYVWTYYTQCVQTLFQDHASKEQNGQQHTSASLATASQPAATSSSSPAVSLATVGASAPTASQELPQQSIGVGAGQVLPPQAIATASASSLAAAIQQRQAAQPSLQQQSLQQQSLQQQSLQQQTLQQQSLQQQQLQQQHLQQQQQHQLQQQQQLQQRQQLFQMQIQQQQQRQNSAGPQVIRPQFQTAMMGSSNTGGSNELQSEDRSGFNVAFGHTSKASGPPASNVGGALMPDMDGTSPSKGGAGGEWNVGKGMTAVSTSFSQPGSVVGDLPSQSISGNCFSANAGQVDQVATSNPGMIPGLLGVTAKSPAMPSGGAPSWKRPHTPQVIAGANQTGVGGGMPSGGVRFPLMGGRPMPNIRPTTPHMRMQMQQAQHEQRMGLMQQAGSQWGQVRAPGFGAPGRPKAMPGKAPPGGLMGGPRPGPQFPPALQKWLQKLFAHQTQSGDTDPALQKQTHTYLRHWVQQWVKTGELWQRNWESAPLPTPDEIRANLPPGALSISNATIGTSAPPMEMPGTPLRPRGPRVVAPPAWVNAAKNLNASAAPTESGQVGFSGPSAPKRPVTRERSRSRSDIRRRRPSNSRRRRRRDSSSSSKSSCSKSACSRKRKDRDGAEESSASEAGDGPARTGDVKGKGKAGKSGMPAAGRDLNRAPLEEARQQVRKFLDDRLQNSIQNGDTRPRHKELQDELQKILGVTSKRFRNLFNQTVAQYCHAFHQRAGVVPVGPPDGAIQKPKVVSQGEQQMRAQRAARFQTHLQVERTPVAMVSFNDSDVASVSGGPLVGALNDMCSREEAREREMTRQLDKFEWKKGTDPRNPEVNLALASKKYQRSSADKAYRSQDVRTLDACWRTMEFLMTEILDFDKNPKPQFAVQGVPYIEVYSYLRDRTRSCRVDLHLQQPRSTAQRTFVETHECCLRFEMLSLFLLQGAGGGSTEKYDEKLGLKAISQTIEPLLNAYQAVRDKQLAKSILAEAMGELALDEPDAEQEYVSPFEPSVHRYIILLLMAFSPEELLTHLAKLSREILSHPLVGFATQAYAAFQTDDYGRFLRLYRNADFFTAVAMSGLADLARLRALWLLVRTYCQPVGDKLSLERLRNVLAFASDSHARSFLAFHGVRVESDGKGGPPTAMLPKKGTPEAAQHPLLTGPNRLPEKCEYPKGTDSMLVSKFEALGLSRADIVFGSADPLAEIEAPVDEGEVPAGSGEEGTLPPRAAADDVPVGNGEEGTIPSGSADDDVVTEIAKDA